MRKVILEGLFWEEEFLSGQRGFFLVEWCYCEQNVLFKEINMYIPKATGSLLDIYASIPVMAELQRLEITFSKMSKLLEVCTCEDDYDLIWDDFWRLNKSVNISIPYYNPDTSSMEDILSRYYTIKDYLTEKEVIL